MCLWLPLALQRDTCAPAWGFRPHSSQSCGGRQQEGNSEGARPGCEGLGGKREMRNLSLTLFSGQNLTRDGPPPGSPRPGPQQPSRRTDVDVHTHSSHTCTRTPHLTFRPSVEDTASVNPVKTSAQQVSGIFPEAGPLGVLFHLPAPPTTPRLDHDIRKSG